MENKKNLLGRMLIGMPLGISIGYVISIIISVIQGDGVYYSAPPELVKSLSGELNAVVFQAGMSALIGLVFGGASMIWEMHQWSLAKQSGVYFLIVSLTMMPVAWFAHWIEHSLKGFLVYFAFFMGVFIVVWLIMYLLLRIKLNKVNKKLN